MGYWVVCISAILACWATLTSAQINICKLRLRLREKYFVLSVVVMDEENNQAKEGLDSALKYLESESPSAINAKSEIYVKNGMDHQIVEDGGIVLILYKYLFNV